MQAFSWSVACGQRLLPQVSQTTIHQAPGLRSQRGAEGPELAPPHVRLLIPPAVVPADVVRPEEAADVARRGRERHLELQHAPVRGGVSREMNGMPVVAPPGPPAE